jgi:hypothetical protein
MKSKNYCKSESSKVPLAKNFEYRINSADRFNLVSSSFRRWGSFNIVSSGSYGWVRCFANSMAVARAQSHNLVSLQQVTLSTNNTNKQSITMTTASSANMDKFLTQHDMNASRFLSPHGHVIDPESTVSDD